MTNGNKYTVSHRTRPKKNPIEDDVPVPLLWIGIVLMSIQIRIRIRIHILMLIQIQIRIRILSQVVQILENYELIISVQAVLRIPDPKTICLRAF